MLLYTYITREPYAQPGSCVIWLIRDYFRAIPIELEECAAINGASRYRVFYSIVLPLAVPGLVATFLFVLVFCWAVKG